eukprot:748547-Hanusia_phi.AAC.2
MGSRDLEAALFPSIPSDSGFQGTRHVSMQRLPILSRRDPPMNGLKGCYDFPSDLKMSLVKLLKKVKFEEVMAAYLPCLGPSLRRCLRKGVSKLFDKPRGREYPPGTVDDEGDGVKDYIDVSYSKGISCRRDSKLIADLPPGRKKEEKSWEYDDDELDGDEDQTPHRTNHAQFVGTHVDTVKEVLSNCPNYYSQILRSLHEIINRVPDFKPKKVICYGSGIGVNLFAIRDAWPANDFPIHCIEPSHQRMDVNRNLESLRVLTWNQIGKHLTEDFQNVVWSQELELQRNAAVRQVNPSLSKNSRDFYGELIMEANKEKKLDDDVIESLDDQSDLVILDLSSAALSMVLPCPCSIVLQKQASTGWVSFSD